MNDQILDELKSKLEQFLELGFVLNEPNKYNSPLTIFVQGFEIQVSGSTSYVGRGITRAFFTILYYENGQKKLLNLPAIEIS